ncbi:hypothetical protein [Alicyclobacillus shizuokensis]|uniref:hypothetical protein n=1 Tax=Alicyclobacillus shizuokensis TaxID=392014 RepID=UPI0008301A65|nr:hypothetical protein [Alicyclobacillus shizuokensis]
MTKILRSILRHPVVRRTLWDLLIECVLMLLQLMWLLVKFLFFVLCGTMARKTRRRRSPWLALKGGKANV